MVLVYSISMKGTQNIKVKIWIVVQVFVFKTDFLILNK